jgi:hypothetical protein
MSAPEDRNIPRPRLPNLEDTTQDRPNADGPGQMSLGVPKIYAPLSVGPVIAVDLDDVLSQTKVTIAEC